MRLNVETRLPWDIEADVLAVAVPAGAAMPEYLSEIDRRPGGGLEEMRKLGAIKGKLWESRLIPAQDMGVRFVLAVGVGDGSSIDRLVTQRSHPTNIIPRSNSAVLSRDRNQVPLGGSLCNRVSDRSVICRSGL